MKNRTYEGLPEDYRGDIEKAITILTGEGCKEIYLFGSLAKGSHSGDSDIDIAVTGLRKCDFFEVYGKLIMELEHPVDLINLEKKTRFANLLKAKGEMVRVS